MMFRRCVMSNGRRLMTAAEHQTNRSHMISPPLKQLLVFRPLSTATRPNHEEEEDRKGGSFSEWMKNIYEEFLRKKKEYEDMKYVHKDEIIEKGGYLKYEYYIGGFKGANVKSMTVQIGNYPKSVLVVSGRTSAYNSDGRSVVIERHITLPTYNNDFSKAKKRATFNSNVGFLFVEISDFKYKEAQDIKVKIEKEV